MEPEGMDSYEFNKIAGAVLGSLLFFMGLGILSSTIFARPHMHKPGYDLPAAAADTHNANACNSSRCNPSVNTISIYLTKKNRLVA